MRTGSLLLSLCFLTLASAPGTANDGPPDWTRESAARAMATIDVGPTVQTLNDLTVSGAETDVLALLEQTRNRDDWPEPARDAAVFRYTRGLSELPAAAVPSTVMDYLVTFEVQTQVPHDDHPWGRVPLLNVRATARGVENGWLRQEARLEGMALLRSSPRSLVDAFLIETHPSVRAGYLEALEESPPTDAGAIVTDTQARLAESPELTPLAGRAALLAGDTLALQGVIDHGAGPDVHRLLREVSDQSLNDTLALLEAALVSRNREAAGLAVSLLYPALAGDPRADAALIARLGDESLGAAAALALARSPALDTQLALEALAASPDRPAARQAQLALTMREELDAERYR